MAVGRAICVGLMACLLVLGAAGISSLEDDDFCGEHGPAVEGSSWTSETAVWPPGWRCVYSLPDGREATAQSGSVGSFLGVLAGELLIVAWIAHAWPRVGGPARISGAATLAFAVAGAAGMVGGFVSAMIAGAMLGVPLAVIGEHTLRRAGGQKAGWHSAPLVAGGVVLALVVAGTLWLFGLGAWAFALAVAGVALLAAVPSAPSMHGARTRG